MPVFRCVAYVIMPDEKQGNSMQKTQKCFVFGVIVRKLRPIG